MEKAEECVETIIPAAVNIMIINCGISVCIFSGRDTYSVSYGFVFSIVLTEAFFIALMGTVLGLGGALLLFNGGKFDAGGFIPGLTVAGRTVALTLAIAAGLALASGLFPARRAARLNVIEALRHIA